MGNHPLRAVLQAQHHPVAFFHAHPVQGGGQPFCFLQQLGIGDDLAKKHQGRFVRITQRTNRQVVPQRRGRRRDAVRQPFWPDFVMQRVRVCSISHCRCSCFRVGQVGLQVQSGGPPAYSGLAHNASGKLLIKSCHLSDASWGAGILNESIKCSVGSNVQLIPERALSLIKPLDVKAQLQLDKASSP